jgi:hypothetical protein
MERTNSEQAKIEEKRHQDRAALDASCAGACFHGVATALYYPGRPKGVYHPMVVLRTGGRRRDHSETPALLGHHSKKTEGVNVQNK